MPRIMNFLSLAQWRRICIRRPYLLLG